jgi:hypothetical protein
MTRMTTAREATAVLAGESRVARRVKALYTKGTVAGFVR